MFHRKNSGSVYRSRCTGIVLCSWGPIGYRKADKYNQIILQGICSTRIYIIEPWASKRRPNAYAKNIDTGQPAQSAQADLSPNVSLQISFLYISEPVYLMIKLVVRNVALTDS